MEAIPSEWGRNVLAAWMRFSMAIQLQLQNTDAAEPRV
jgi:hypothetical protein